MAAEPENTDKDDIADLFGDSDEEDFQPEEQQQQQPQDEAEAAPEVRSNRIPHERQRRSLALSCWPDQH